MRPATTQAITQFQAVLRDLPPPVRRTIVAVIREVCRNTGWLGLAATADDASLAAAIATADAHAVLRIATPTIAGIITGAELRSDNPTPATLLNRMATYLADTDSATIIAGIEHRLDAYQRASAHQRRAEHDAATRQREAQTKQAAEAAHQAQQHARRAVQRADGIRHCIAGTVVTTEGGHTIIYTADQPRSYQCTRCQAAWTRMPQWHTPCAGEPTLSARVERTRTADGEPPPASPREAQARRVRDALLSLPDAALRVVAEQRTSVSGPDPVAAFRAIVPTLTVDDWWEDLIPTLIRWLQTEPYGALLRDWAPEAGLPVIDPLLTVVQRLDALHRGRPVPITTTAAAIYLGVTVDKLRAWIGDGTLPVLKTVKGSYGRGSVKYVLDCSAVIQARARLATDIARFQQRRQRGLHAVATAIQQTATAHEATLERIAQLGPPLAAIFRAAYFCWHLNHFAKARAGVARSICYAMKDRVLEAIVSLADRSAGQAAADGWALPLVGDGSAAVSLAWHPAGHHTYLSIVIGGPGFRFPFHAREDQARRWLPPDLQHQIPHQTLAADRAFTFGGRPASWLEARAIPYAHVADVLCAWWYQVTRRAPAEFTARLPSQHASARPLPAYPWDEDEQDRALWASDSAW